MIRNFLFFLFGLFGGLWLVWPGVSTSKGWDCTKDIIFNSDKEPTDSASFLEDLTRKLKLSSAVSTKTLLKAETLNPLEKLRIAGEASFR